MTPRPPGDAGPRRAGAPRAARPPADAGQPVDVHRGRHQHAPDRRAPACSSSTPARRATRTSTASSPRSAPPRWPPSSRPTTIPTTGRSRRAWPPTSARRRSGSAPAATTCRERTVADGEVLDSGEVRMRAIHTPGHAPDHLCYLLDDGAADERRPRHGLVDVGDRAARRQPQRLHGVAAQARRPGAARDVPGARVRRSTIRRRASKSCARTASSARRQALEALAAGLDHDSRDGRTDLRRRRPPAPPRGGALAAGAPRRAGRAGPGAGEDRERRPARPPATSWFVDADAASTSAPASPAPRAVAAPRSRRTASPPPAPPEHDRRAPRAPAPAAPLSWLRAGRGIRTRNPGSR